jgi:RimJ/RimL family protein N-acetyltransferase
MTARNRLPPWHEYFTLTNGRELLSRPIRPEDSEPLRGTFALLGPDEIRQRMLPAASELTPDVLHRLTHPNPKLEITLVAAEPLPPGEALVGAIARASIIPGTRDAEYTILISNFMAGQGLGRHLVRKLVKWARRKYLDRLYGVVREDNLPMLQLAESLGFKQVPSPDTPGLTRVVLELGQG